MRLILASASPRRAELLRSAGYTFDVVVADVDESIRSGESPAAYVRRLAAEKSFRAAADLGRPRGDVPSSVVSGFGRTEGSPPVGGHHREEDDPVILGADTAVVVDGAILGKPRDEEDARGMLSRLSGRAHHVLTGISL